jgi:hypothetical protein
MPEKLPRASGADREAISLVASADQKSIFEFTQAIPARLACSHASRNSFCISNIAPVGSFPNWRNGIDGSVGLLVGILPLNMVVSNPSHDRSLMYIKDNLREIKNFQLAMGVEHGDQT